MKRVGIGSVLYAKRCEKGITQEELADFMGVSRASVSKWENGHSYPDIEFLPHLAAFFDISLDELMGYDRQLTDGEIRKIYADLSAGFASKPFDEAMDRCRNAAKKYHFSPSLLYQIGVLYLNYASQAQDEVKKDAVLAEAKALLVRAKRMCDSIELKHLALHAEAACEMMLGNPGKVTALLENEKRHGMNPSLEGILSQSYAMLGQVEDAKITLQCGFLNRISGFFNDIPFYLSICSGEPDHFEEVCKRALQMIDIFHIKELYPAGALPFYLAAAGGYMAMGNPEKALAMLEGYTEMAAGGIFPIKPKGDPFFTLLSEIQERQRKELPFGIPDLPRDEQIIKKDMVETVTHNPAFFPLHETERFQRLAKRLQQHLS